MNMRLFVESLTLVEMNELGNLIWEKKREFAKAMAKPLTFHEVNLAREGKKIEAIKVYRNRINCSLLEAKIAIEVGSEN